MKSVLRDFLRFAWRRDSESACILIIGLSWWLDDADCRQLADYMTALMENMAFTNKSQSR